MSIFKKTVTKTGKVNIFKDGHAVKAEDVESLPTVVKNLEADGTIELTIVEPTPVTVEEPVYAGVHVSVVSGKPATKRRYLNGQEYWLTEEEHSSLTLGKLAQAIRENSQTVEEKPE